MPKGNTIKKVSIDKVISFMTEFKNQSDNGLVNIAALISKHKVAKNIIKPMIELKYVTRTGYGTYKVNYHVVEPIMARHVLEDISLLALICKEKSLNKTPGIKLPKDERRLLPIITPKQVVTPEAKSIPTKQPDRRLKMSLIDLPLDQVARSLEINWETQTAHFIILQRVKVNTLSEFPE